MEGETGDRRSGRRDPPPDNPRGHRISCPFRRGVGLQDQAVSQQPGDGSENGGKRQRACEEQFSHNKADKGLSVGMVLPGKQGSSYRTINGGNDE